MKREAKRNRREVVCTFPDCMRQLYTGSFKTHLRHRHLTKGAMYNDTWHRKLYAQAVEDLTSENVPARGQVQRFRVPSRSAGSSSGKTTVAGTPGPEASGTRPPMNGCSDPIEAHVLLAYNTLNDEIIRHEEVVEALLQRVETKPR